MRIITIIAVAGINFLLAGCYSGCEKIDLTPAELEWFDVYKTGQTIVFKSNLGRFDTLIVESRYNGYTPCNKFELSSYQYNGAKIRIRPVSINDSDHIINCSFEKEERDQPCLKCFWVFDLNGCYNELADTLKSEEVFVPFLDKKTSSFRVDKNTGSGSGYSEVSAFNWSKEHGLVRYEIGEEVFELIYHK